MRERDGSQRRLPRGLALLPEPDDGDVYLDFEGDPWAEGGAGREYLAGIWTRQEEFVDFWAHDWTAEGHLTTQLLDWLTERWARHPGMHVYHYAPYEVTALKRLVGQHATREAELDQLLRHEVFVDLYAVVRQGVRISKDSYSIKKLEEFYWNQTRPKGGDTIADGLTSVVEYERWVAGRDDGRPTRPSSTRSATTTARTSGRRWRCTTGSRRGRDDLVARGHALTRPVPEPPKEIGDKERAEIELAERLVGDDHLLLAGLVGWHRREKRPEWWDYFRYKDLETAELVEDPTAIGDITGIELVERVKRSNVWRYTFPPQECRPSLGQYISDVDTHETVGKVARGGPGGGVGHHLHGGGEASRSCPGVWASRARSWTTSCARASPAPERWRSPGAATSRRASSRPSCPRPRRWRRVRARRRRTSSCGSAAASAARCSPSRGRRARARRMPGRPSSGRCSTPACGSASPRSLMPS